MSEPNNRPTAEQPAVTPTVSTDPGRSRWHWSAVPSHLGRARTSTVVLGLLFLAIGALYLYIRPDTVAPTTAGTTSGTVVQNTPAPTTAAPRTTAPHTTATPKTTANESTAPTTSAPTDTSLSTDTSAPTDTTGSTATLPTLTPQTAPDTTPSSPTP